MSLSEAHTSPRRAAVRASPYPDWTTNAPEFHIGMEPAG
jgi:hypothetical protein